MAISIKKMKNWLEEVLEKPFYEAEMARARTYQVKGEDLLVVLLASLIILCLSLFV